MNVYAYGAPEWLRDVGWANLAAPDLGEAEFEAQVAATCGRVDAEGVVIFAPPWSAGASPLAAAGQDLDLQMRRTRQVCSGAVRAMRGRGFGRVVLVAPSFPIMAPEDAAGWEFSAWLSGLTRGLALESAADGVTINAVLIGIPANIDGAGDEGFTPDELRHAVRLFLEREAGYLTGQVMHLCGGKSMVSVFSY